VMVVPGAFRTWKLIKDGGPGERGWLAAQGVLLTVQQPPGIRTPCHATPRTLFNIKIPAKSRSKSSHRSRGLPREAEILLNSVPSSSIPESHDALVAHPCSPPSSLVSTKCFPTSRIYTTSSATYYTNCVDTHTALGFKASGGLPVANRVLTILQHSCQLKFKTRAPQSTRS